MSKSTVGEMRMQFSCDKSWTTDGELGRLNLSDLFYQLRYLNQHQV